MPARPRQGQGRGWGGRGRGRGGVVGGEGGAGALQESTQGRAADREGHGLPLSTGFPPPMAGLGLSTLDGLPTYMGARFMRLRAGMRDAC